MQLHITEKSVWPYDIKSGEKCPIPVDFIKSRINFSFAYKNSTIFSE